MTQSQISEHRLNLRLVQGLLLEQLEHQAVEHVSIIDQDVVGLLVCGLDQGAHLLVDGRGNILGVVAHMTHVPSQEHLALLLPVSDCT